MDIGTHPSFGEQSAKKGRSDEQIVDTHVYTSESVSEGHPDKIWDQISDAILACLAQIQRPTGCETAVGPDLVVNLGEITCKGWDKINPQAIARDVVKDIGYDDPKEGFSYESFKYLCAIHGQSADIKKGVDRGAIKRQGAGDQGMMFGYASNATPELMPAPIIFAHRLLKELTRYARRKQSNTFVLIPRLAMFLHENDGRDHGGGLPSDTGCPDRDDSQGSEGHCAGGLG